MQILLIKELSKKHLQFIFSILLVSGSGSFFRLLLSPFSVGPFFRIFEPLESNIIYTFLYKQI